MQNPGAFFGELRWRNVIRMHGLYLVAAWPLVQVSRMVLPMFDAPAWQKAMDVPGTKANKS